MKPISRFFSLVVLALMTTLLLSSAIFAKETPNAKTFSEAPQAEVTTLTTDARHDDVAPPGNFVSARQSDFSIGETLSQAVTGTSERTRNLSSATLPAEENRFHCVPITNRARSGTFGSSADVDANLYYHARPEAERLAAVAAAAVARSGTRFDSMNQRLRWRHTNMDGF